MKIITGGQSGADLAGWKAAKKFGLQTGGFMPRGFLTEDGPRPEYATLYGAREHSHPSYPPRTRANVDESSVLVWFGDPKSPGGKLTVGYAKTRGLWIYVVENDRSDWGPAAVARHVANAFEQVANFPQAWNDKGLSLMVAGNRESSNRGIGAWVEAYLCDVFRALGYTPVETIL